MCLVKFNENIFLKIFFKISPKTENKLIRPLDSSFEKKIFQENENFGQPNFGYFLSCSFFISLYYIQLNETLRFNYSLFSIISLTLS